MLSSEVTATQVFISYHRQFRSANMKMSWLKQEINTTGLCLRRFTDCRIIIFGGSSLFNSQGKLQIDPTIEPFISRDSTPTKILFRPNRYLAMKKS